MVDHGGGQGPHGGRGSQIVREMNVCASCVADVPEAPRLETAVDAAAVASAPAS